MTDADDEPKFTSIKERIAALKLQNAAGGAPPEAGRRPAPVLAAAKWVQVGSQPDQAPRIPTPPEMHTVREAPPTPQRPVLPPRVESENAGSVDDKPPPARRHHSATRLGSFGMKKKAAAAPRARLVPPALSDGGEEEDAHASTTSPPSAYSATLPAIPRRPSATPTHSADSASDSVSLPAARRPPPALPMSKRPPLPTSVFIKAGQKPKTKLVAPAEPEKPENPRIIAPTLAGLKPATTDGATFHVPSGNGHHAEEQEEEDEPPTVASVAARAAAIGRKIPAVPVPGRPPILPTRSSNGSDQSLAPVPGRPLLLPARSRGDQAQVKPLVPRTALPALPTAARPPVPNTNRPPVPVTSPPLPARRTLVPEPEAEPEQEPEEAEQDEEQEAPQSVSARASALGRRLPPMAQGGKPPPIPGCGHDPTVPANYLNSNGGPPPIPSNRPPPVPMGSRPRAAPAAAPVVNLTRAPPFDYANAPQGSTCLFCRDFSGPDCVAAQYPLSSLPHDDPVGYLAAVLCGPFESATDKARAIFTWCHHNIVYDVDGFFSGCIPRGQTTSQQIFSGKAVCEGYANIYMEIAKHAGLEVVKITGHGKGYGYKTFHPGDPLPEITGHAWNAVQIDGAQWKLLDSCWGAGAVEPGRYIKRFEPSEFTAANEVFGLRHYPSDGRSFYRADGATPDWEDYLVGPTPGLELPAFYSHCLEEGFDKTSLEPVVRLVDPATAAQDGYVRFLASHICEHWDGAKHGKGPMYPIILNIKDAQNKTDLRPMETDGFWYWIDVPVHELPRGGEVFLSIVTSINNEDVRGKGNDYFAKMKGRSAMSWAHIASWNLA